MKQCTLNVPKVWIAYNFAFNAFLFIYLRLDI